MEPGGEDKLEDQPGFGIIEVTWLEQSHPLPKAIRVLRVKKSPTTSLVNRDSATRRARRLDVEFDVGNLCFALRSVRSREAAPAFISSGTMCAMVGALGSFRWGLGYLPKNFRQYSSRTG